MSNKLIAIAAAAVVVACLTWSSLTDRQAAGQLAPAQPVVPAAMTGGRYQMVVTSDHSVYVLDTQTGHVWWRQQRGGDGWNDWGSPVIKVKK